MWCLLQNLMKKYKSETKLFYTLTFLQQFFTIHKHALKVDCVFLTTKFGETSGKHRYHAIATKLHTLYGAY